MKSYTERPTFVQLICEFRDGSNSRLKEETIKVTPNSKNGIDYAVSGFITGYSNGQANLYEATWDYGNEGVNFCFYEGSEPEDYPELMSFSDDVYTVWYAVPKREVGGDELSAWLHFLEHGDYCECDECLEIDED